MGEVYEVVEHPSGERRALKVVHAHLLHSLEATARFTREIQVLRAIDHPSMCRVFDDGLTDDGRPYFVMELLEGCSFREWLSAHPGSMHRDAALDLFAQVLAPLSAAHARGVIHRDLKPENLFVADPAPGAAARGPQLKLLDFGIAAAPDSEHATQTGLTMGSPAYMSPEQAVSPRQCTPASDVWSLGVMLYEIITGALPFRAETPLAMCMEVMRATPSDLVAMDLDLPRPLAQLIMRCLDKNPEARPADARALELALATVRGQTRTVPVSLPTPRTGPSRGRRRAGLAALIGAAVLLTGFAWSLREAPPSPPRPTTHATTVVVPAVAQPTLPARASIAVDLTPPMAAPSHTGSQAPTSAAIVVVEARPAAPRQLTPAARKLAGVSRPLTAESRQPPAESRQPPARSTEPAPAAPPSFAVTAVPVEAPVSAPSPAVEAASVPETTATIATAADRPRPPPEPRPAVRELPAPRKTVDTRPPFVTF